MCWKTTNDSDKKGHISWQRFRETNFFLQVSVQIEVGLLQQVAMLAWQSHSKAVKEIPAKYNQSQKSKELALSTEYIRIPPQDTSKYSFEFMFYPMDIHFVTLDQRLEGQTCRDGMRNPCDKL